MKTDQELMDEFFETHEYDETPLNWLSLPELGEEQEDEEDVD